MKRSDPNFIPFGNRFDDWYYNAWYAPLWPLGLVLAGVLIIWGISWLL